MKKAILLLLGSLCIYSCHFFQALKPKGNTISKEIVQSPIYTIENNSSLPIEFTSKINKNTVLIEGEESVVNNIEIRFDNGSILFSNKSKKNFNPSDVKILINAPEVSSLLVHNTGDISTSDFTFTNNLNITITGTSNVNADINNDITSLSVSGTGKVFLTGKTSNFTINNSGTANINAEKLIGKQGLVNISGTGYAKVYITQQLNATVSGTGSILYKDITDLSIRKSVSGIGKITSF